VGEGARPPGARARRNATPSGDHPLIGSLELDQRSLEVIEVAHLHLFEASSSRRTTAAS
jgi:hypothetical protein